MAAAKKKKPAQPRGVSKTNKDGSKVDETGKVHARLSASESSRWMNCPGSVRAIEALPESLKRRSSYFADEGVAAHALGELCLEQGKDAAEFIGQEIAGFEVDDDMAQAVQVYIDEIKDQLKRLPGAELRVEQRFDLTWLREDMFGTNDASVAEAFGTLIVTDYKHGKGVPVYAEWNTQLMYYALGAAKLEDFNFTDVEIVVVQPRCNVGDSGVRRWHISMEALEKWGLEELGPAADRTREIDAPLKAGKHCKFCSNAGVCKAPANQAMDAAVADFKDDPIELPVFPDRKDNGAPMSDEEMAEHLSQALKWAPMIETWLKATYTAAYQLAESGVEIPERKLVEGLSDRMYAKNETDVVKALKKAGLKMDDMYVTPPAKLKSPAQMEKISKDAKAAVAKLVERKPTGRKLVHESHKSPAVKPGLNTDFDAVSAEDYVD